MVESATDIENELRACAYAPLDYTGLGLRTHSLTHLGRSGM